MRRLTQENEEPRTRFTFKKSLNSLLESRDNLLSWRTTAALAVRAATNRAVYILLDVKTVTATKALAGGSFLWHGNSGEKGGEGKEELIFMIERVLVFRGS